MAIQHLGEITDAYNTYIASYGDKAWAISLESSIWLAEFIVENADNTWLIYDMGSGFTSWVLRRFGNHARVISVDSSPFWLGITRSYLRSMAIPMPELVTLDAVKQDNPGVGDMVVCDIKGDIRTKELPFMFSLLKPDGVFFADDANRREYMCVAVKQAQEHGLSECTDLVHITDSYGRYPAVLHTTDWQAKLSIT